MREFFGGVLAIFLGIIVVILMGLSVLTFIGGILASGQSPWWLLLSLLGMIGFALFGQLLYEIWSY